MPYGLALHTSSTQLGLALIDCDDIHPSHVCTCSHNLGRDMVTHLHLHVLDFLAPQTWSDLGFIAVAKGPGSFTSTRLGVVMARTIGQQLAIPVFGISTLEAAAYADVRAGSGDRGDRGAGVVRSQTECDRAVELEAARGEVFTGIYRYDRDRDEMIGLQADAAMSPQAWQDTLASRATVPLSLQVDRANITQDTAAMATLAQRRWQRGDRPTWSEVVPFYGQHPVT
jgi:tRNA threonylcarbamoyl adenosine modification protein YeaZ